MNNLPIGSKDDPRAPWNQPDIDDLCRYCDKDILWDICVEETHTKEQIKEGEIDKEKVRNKLSEYKECRSCYIENNL